MELSDILQALMRQNYAEAVDNRYCVDSDDKRYWYWMCCAGCYSSVKGWYKKVLQFKGFLRFHKSYSGISQVEVMAPPDRCKEQRWTTFPVLGWHGWTRDRMMFLAYRTLIRQLTNNSTFSKLKQHNCTQDEDDVNYALPQRIRRTPRIRTNYGKNYFDIKSPKCSLE